MIKLIRYHLPTIVKHVLGGFPNDHLQCHQYHDNHDHHLCRQLHHQVGQTSCPWCPAEESLCPANLHSIKVLYMWSSDCPFTIIKRSANLLSWTHCPIQSYYQLITSGFNFHYWSEHQSCPYDRTICCKHRFVASLSSHIFCSRVGRGSLTF